MLYISWCNFSSMGVHNLMYSCISETIFAHSNICQGLFCNSIESCVHNVSKIRDCAVCLYWVKDLQWDTLQTRRKIKRLSITYKMEHNLIDIPLDHYIQHNTRSSRKHDSQFLQIRYSANIFGNSFSPTTIKEWNSLPLNTASSESLNSFQNNLVQHVRRPTMRTGVMCP